MCSALDNKVGASTVRRRVARGCGARAGTAAVAIVTALALWACGCEDMSDQPRFEPMEGTSFFGDGLSARQPVPGTVSRDEPVDDDRVTTGRNPDGTLVIRSPIEPTVELLRRGQTRFNIICANCHGRIGDGQGMIVSRGFPRPPTYHDDRLRLAPDGHYFDVITNGFGKMYSFADQLTPVERWAVIGYIRALQCSQNAAMDDVPTEVRDKLTAEDKEVGHAG